MLIVIDHFWSLLVLKYTLSDQKLCRHIGTHDPYSCIEFDQASTEK